MATNTANGLPYPALTDSNNPPADIQALAVAVDGAYGKSVANAAALPASGAFAGQRLWLLDVKRHATWNGTAWETDSAAWITPTLGNSWVSFDAGAVYDIPQYAKVGRFVVFKGRMKSGTVATAAFTLPAGMRPLKSRVWLVSASGGVALIQVTSAGVVSVAGYISPATNAYVDIEIPPFVAEQ